MAEEAAEAVEAARFSGHFLGGEAKFREVFPAAADEELDVGPVGEGVKWSMGL